MVDGNDIKKALKLAQAIGELDELVFGEELIDRNGIEIRIIKAKPKQEDNYVQYVPKEKSKTGKDYYEIFEYIDKIVEAEIQKYRHIYPQPEKKWEDFSPYTEEDFFVAIAAHEVRHRVQSNLQISLFSPKDVDKTEDPYLRFLIELLTIEFNLTPRKGDFLEEFDAEIIQFLAVEIWRKSKSPFEIARLVKKDAKELLNQKII